MQVSFSQQTIGWTATMALNTPTLPPPQQSDRHRGWYVPSSHQHRSRIHPERHDCARYPPFPPFQRSTTAPHGTSDSAACFACVNIQTPAQAPRNFSSGCSPSEPPPFSHCAAGPACPAAAQSRPGPADCGRDTYARFEPAIGDSHVPSVACELLLGQHDDDPNKDKLTS
jgi:hypothetical protein